VLIVVFFIEISDVSQFARQLKENPAGSPQYGVFFWVVSIVIPPD
jgi:hypothetical protein